MKFTAARVFLVPGLIGAALLVIGPLTGWPPTLRLSAVIGGALLLAIPVARPWRWNETQWQRLTAFEPRPSAIALGALVAALVLFWIVLTLFQGGHINGVDFTIYFDRPLYQTIHGRPMYVETTDDPPFAHVT